MRGLAIIGLRLQTIGRTLRPNTWQPLTSVRRPIRLCRMDGDMADSLSECISTASYKIRERRRRNYQRSSPRISPFLRRIRRPALRTSFKHSKISPTSFQNEACQRMKESVKPVGDEFARKVAGMRYYEEVRRYRAVSRVHRRRVCSPPSHVSARCRAHTAASRPTHRYSGGGYRDRVKHPYL